MKPVFCGLIGAGIQGSRAPVLHEREAAAQGLQLAYKLIDLDVLGVGPDALPGLLRDAALRLGARELVIVDREPERSGELAARMNSIHGQRCAVAADITRALAGASGLIHATPTGMAKMHGMPLPESLLRPELWVSEVVYVPLETELLRGAKRAACRIMDGGHMNVGQALGAFRLFTGREADAARMDAHFRSLYA